LQIPSPNFANLGISTFSSKRSRGFDDFVESRDVSIRRRHVGGALDFASNACDPGEVRVGATFRTRKR
jgi:hypothetical protein